VNSVVSRRFEPAQPHLRGIETGKFISRQRYARCCLDLAANAALNRQEARNVADWAK
jgi:hypothetical protein